MQWWVLWLTTLIRGGEILIFFLLITAGTCCIWNCHYRLEGIGDCSGPPLAKMFMSSAMVPSDKSSITRPIFRSKISTKPGPPLKCQHQPHGDPVTSEMENTRVCRVEMRRTLQHQPQPPLNNSRLPPIRLDKCDTIKNTNSLFHFKYLIHRHPPIYLMWQRPRSRSISFFVWNTWIWTRTCTWNTQVKWLLKVYLFSFPVLWGRLH